MKKRFCIQFLGALFVLMVKMVTAYSANTSVIIPTIEGVQLGYLLLDSEKCWLSGVVDKSYSGAVTIPSCIEYEGNEYSVTSIFNGAFKNSHITSIYIPEGVTSIGKWAFQNCSSLTDVHIPASMRKIEEDAFSGCKISIYLANLAAWNSVSFYSSDEDEFFVSHLYMNGEEIKDLVIPDGVTEIGMGAYRCFMGLTSVKIPNSVKTIDSYAFEGCGNITSVVIEEGVTSIRNSAFSGCKSLTSIIMPNSIISIYGGAFYGCSSLSSIVIPHSVTDLEENAFRECSNLKQIIYLSWLSSKCGSNAKVYNLDNILEVVIPNNTYTYSGKHPDIVLGDIVPDVSIGEGFDVSSMEKNVGSYSVNIPLLFDFGSTTFEKSYEYKYSVIPARATAKVKDSSRLYGDENPQFEATYSGFVNGESTSVITNDGVFTTTATATSNVGTYVVKIGGVTADNYTFAYEQGELQVCKAPLQISVKDYNRQYGRNNPTYDMEYKGLKNGEVAPEWTNPPVITSDATSMSDVGNYVITADGGVLRNYEFIGIGSGTLTITPAPLVVAASDASMPYYSTVPELSYRYQGFLVGDDERVVTTKPTIQTDASMASPVGTYPIEVYGASAKNYEISYSPGTLTILKRSLTVSTDDYSRAYGEENPNFELAYSGFVNNESLDVISSLPIASTTALVDSDTGQYPIVITGGEAQNYDFVYNGGTLTIEKAYQTLEWDQDLSIVGLYDQIELTCKASSGLDITYSITGNEIGSIIQVGRKTFLDCSRIGEGAVVAVQEGDNNYWPTTKLYKPIKIVPTAVNDLTDGQSPDVESIYDLNGHRISTLQRGINILRMNDGTTRKVLKK